MIQVGYWSHTVSDGRRQALSCLQWRQLSHGSPDQLCTLSQLAAILDEEKIYEEPLLHAIDDVQDKPVGGGLAT